jgi:hypothetical protein
MERSQGWDAEEGCDDSFENERKPLTGIDLICYAALPAFYLIQGVKYIARIPSRIGNSLVKKAFSEVGGLEEKDLD